RAQRGDEGDRLVEHQVMAGFGDLDAGRARRRLRALPCDHALVHQLRLAAPDDGDGAARGVEADGRVAVAILRPEGRIEAPGHARRGLRHLAQRATRDVVHGVEVLAVLWGEEAVARERARHVGIDPVGAHRPVLAARGPAAATAALLALL